MRKNEENRLAYFIYLFVVIILITHFVNDVLDLTWYLAALVAGALGAAAYYIWVGILRLLNK
jgi:hypothetical protein